MAILCYSIHDPWVEAEKRACEQESQGRYEKQRWDTAEDCFWSCTFSRGLSTDVLPFEGDYKHMTKITPQVRQVQLVQLPTKVSDRLYRYRRCRTG